MTELRVAFRKYWQVLRRLTGDDAYEHYLEHWRACHAHEITPPDRRTFYRNEIERRWNSVRRCC